MLRQKLHATLLNQTASYPIIKKQRQKQERKPRKSCDETIAGNLVGKRPFTMLALRHLEAVAEGKKEGKKEDAASGQLAL